MGPKTKSDDNDNNNNEQTTTNQQKKVELIKKKIIKYESKIKRLNSKIHKIETISFYSSPTTNPSGWQQYIATMNQEYRKYIPQGRDNNGSAIDYVPTPISNSPTTNKPWGNGMEYSRI